jgi:hypothetical protein
MIVLQLSLSASIGMLMSYFQQPITCRGFTSISTAFVLGFSASQTMTKGSKDWHNFYQFLSNKE